jgi:ribosomal protein L12E/L44/L45/RPP1/RPP2
MPFKLAGKLSLNSESFKKGLDKSGQAVKKMGTRMSSTFSRIGRRAKVAAHKIKKGFNGAAAKVKGAFAGVGGKIAAVAGAAAIMDQVKQTIDWGAKVRDLANAWGISTSEVQQFQYAARQSGIEIEDVMDNMKDLAKSAAEATAGNEGKASMFKTLGIDVDQLRNKNPAEIFRLVAAAIEKMDDTTTPEALVAIEGLGGGAGIKTLNMMKSGFADLTAEAEKLGLVIEDGVIQKLGGASDKMAEMSDRWRAGWASALGFIFDAWDHFTAMLQAGMDATAERLTAIGEGRIGDFFAMGVSAGPEELAARQKKIMDDKKREREDKAAKKAAAEELQRKLDNKMKEAATPKPVDKAKAAAAAAKVTEAERRQKGWGGFQATSLEKIGGGLGMKTTQLNVAQQHLALAKKAAERAVNVANNVQEIKNQVAE